MVDTLVDYHYEPNGPTPFKCGYCKSPDTSKIQGVQAHRMTCQVFQELVDRGFQRSGKFVYRPFMTETCCPQYVFRIDVAKFRLSKQQRATIRKMNKYLVEGCLNAASKDGEHENIIEEEAGRGEYVTEEGAVRTEGDTVEESGGSKSKTKPAKSVQPGLGADPTKPHCKKAKLLRRERRAKKTAEKTIITPKQAADTAERAEQVECSNTDPSPVVEWQEEKLALPPSPSYTHQLTKRLVPCYTSDSVFMSTYEESYRVFQKYQLSVHRDNLEDWKESSFRDFLVETPLTRERAPEGAPCDYGTYHLQYLIDGKIYAVGVLDILPKGVLSKYLYYDPAYRFIAPGVYSALYEISLAQKFYKASPEMKYYYMGFYVQSCPKVECKKQYASSELLCPETYKYVPLQQCIPRLKISDYSRLDCDSPVIKEESEATDEVVDNLNIMHNMVVMPYREFRSRYGTGRDEMVRKYLQLVGQKAASKSTLHIPAKSTSTALSICNVHFMFVQHGC